MASSLVVGDAFVLFLVALGYVPVLRAYTIERVYPWLVGGYTTLLIGRIASVVESFYRPALFNLVEHGVGITLVAVCFALHFYREWRTEDSPYRSDRAETSPETGRETWFR